MSLDKKSIENLKSAIATKRVDNAKEEKAKLDAKLKRVNMQSRQAAKK